jgi:hypothetical protein
MEVYISILIGEKRGRGVLAHKTIDLPFAPVVGMRYHDTTWKDPSGREITHVTIDYDDGFSELSVALQPDDNGDPEIYRAHGWKVM